MIKHSIDTGNAMTVLQKPPRMSTKQKQEVGKLVDDMLDDGVISTSLSPWSSPIVVAKKKDGSVRFCVDYRALNNCTKKCSYPLPRIDGSLDELSGCGYFSTLDLKSGYWQIPMYEKDKKKTAEKISERFYWLRWRESVTAYCKECQLCDQRKNHQQLQRLSLFPLRN